MYSARGRAWTKPTSSEHTTCGGSRARSLCQLLRMPRTAPQPRRTYGGAERMRSVTRSE